jgi:AraC-like DNA-binding protein
LNIYQILPFLEHIEFIHDHHFINHYFREKPVDETLQLFIEYFWETKFDNLWTKYPEGFKDSLFPNIGCTYFINLGTPCKIVFNNKTFNISKEAFLPRAKPLTLQHFEGNKVFGIKFLASPILLEKKINFIEYQNFVYPLTFLIDQNILSSTRRASSFKERMEISCEYFAKIITGNKLQKNPVFIVTEIIHYCISKQQYNLPLSFFVNKLQVSSKSIQRYFASTTGLNYKQAISILRIRAAIESKRKNIKTPCTTFGFYDNSHYLKELKKFAGPHFTAIKKLTDYKSSIKSDLL